MNDDYPNPRVIYADIISLPHCQSSKHPHMSLHDRAAQFAPFAALVGFDEMVSEEARLTERRVAPGESDLEALNSSFRCLAEQLSAGRRPAVTVCFFVPDPRKAGGRYETVTGRARRLDTDGKRLILLGEGSPAEEISLDMDSVLDLSFVTSYRCSP